MFVLGGHLEEDETVSTVAHGFTLQTTECTAWLVMFWLATFVNAKYNVQPAW